jgi:hypothetical protein
MSLFPSYISASVGIGGVCGEASDGVFGYVNSHRQTLVETSGGSKRERVFAFRELAETYVFGRRMVGSPGVLKRAVQLARLLHAAHI